MRKITSGSALSYQHGGGHIPLLGHTVGSLLDRTAARWPDRDALIVVNPPVRWSWSELRDKSRAIAAGLLAQGLEPGDRVGMLAPNCAEWPLVQFGTAYAGLVLVNINPAYRPPELEFALNKVGCRALIVAPEFKTSDYLAILNELAPELATATPGELNATRLPELRKVIRLGRGRTPGTLSLDEVMKSAGDSDLESLLRICASLDFDDAINIQFTSGTTGTPKAATLSHHNIVNNANISAQIMNITEQDRLCVPVPMYHCFGMVLGTLLCAAGGATIVLPSPGFDARATLEAIESERCTALHGVPTMFIAMLDEPDFDKFDLESLRTGIMAGAPCPAELMRRVMHDLHVPEITIGYGMTETGPLSTQTFPDDAPDLRTRTVGRPIPNTETKIVDKAGRIVDHGIPGELCTRGYCVMQGYWDDAERTAQDIDENNWIHSGDIATMDKHGYVRIVGRIKEMLIRGGENIYPREIEEFLYSDPRIDEVEVFGVPDPKFGEEVAAWIRLRDGQQATADDIREYCRGKLAHFKIPKYIRFVDEFPMTVTGKVQKFVMREQMAAELGVNH